MQHVVEHCMENWALLLTNTCCGNVLLMPKKLKLNGCMKPYRPSRTNTQKRCLFIIADCNAKCRKSRDTWINKFGLGVKSEAGQRLTDFCQKKVLVIANTSSKSNSTHGHHQMLNTEIRLITVFAAKDGEALYSQQKQDWELTVAQIINSLLPNSDLNWRK